MRTIRRSPRELKTHLTDLAAYHHAQAQKSRQPADKATNYAQAAQWYRLQLQYFPQDTEAPQVNFHLADALVRKRRLRACGG